MTRRVVEKLCAKKVCVSFLAPKNPQKILGQSWEVFVDVFCCFFVFLSFFFFLSFARSPFPGIGKEWR